MNALNEAIRAEVSSGALTQDEYDGMTIPTWNRTLGEFTAPFDDGDALGLTLLESEVDLAPDAYLAAYRNDHDAHTFGTAVSGFLRAFTEPSLFAGLNRAPGRDRRSRTGCTPASPRPRPPTRRRWRRCGTSRCSGSPGPRRAPAWLDVRGPRDVSERSGERRGVI